MTLGGFKAPSRLWCEPFKGEEFLLWIPREAGEERLEGLRRAGRVFNESGRNPGNSGTGWGSWGGLFLILNQSFDLSQG